MRKTYDRTMFISNEELQKATIRLYVTEGLKWTDDKETEITFTGLVRWSIVNEYDGLKIEIENNFDESQKDEYQEYLVLEFNDGTTKIFRNSHVDMFIR